MQQNITTTESAQTALEAPYQKHERERREFRAITSVREAIAARPCAVDKNKKISVEFTASEWALIEQVIGQVSRKKMQDIDMECFGTTASLTTQVSDAKTRFIGYAQKEYARKWAREHSERVGITKSGGTITFDGKKIGRCDVNPDIKCWSVYDLSDEFIGIVRYNDGKEALREYAAAALITGDLDFAAPQETQ